MQGMRLLKGVHHGFGDLQIYFDLETFGNLSQLQVDPKTSPSQGVIKLSLSSIFDFFFHFSIFPSPCMLIKRAPYHTSFLWFVCDPNLVTWGTGKGLTCETISGVDRLSVGKKDKGHRTPRLPTQATGSLEPGRKEHTVAGNTLEQSLLICSLSHRGPSFLQGAEGQDGLADVRVFLAPEEMHTFIHSSVYSFIPRS